MSQHRVQPREIQAAIDDLYARTLARLSALERLVYVASTRDYNSSRYYHGGLEARFGMSVAASALLYAHEETFAAVTFLPLGRLADELHGYMEKSRERPEVFLNSWQKLEPFRVAIPLHADPVAAELFISNIKLALAVVKYRLRVDPPGPSTASPQPSLDPQSQLGSHS